MDKIKVNLNINSKLYLKDPVTTELGKKIIKNSVSLIDELGLDDFSFRKLARKISSTESSIYRYFENKNYLFTYLINWYWEWTSTRIDLSLNNIKDSTKKLKIIIKLLIEASLYNADTEFVDEEILHRIVIREGTKAYHHKLVEEENKYGFFLSYKALCKKISLVILELNPKHNYPKALASTLVETANNNIYFAKHLPRLTDVKFNEKDNNPNKINEQIFDILYHMATSSISHKLTKKAKPIKLNGNKIVFT
jgi:AcrR family transcriptional regulator